VTAAIVWLSRRGNTLPGILPLFPTFALIALLVIGAKGDSAGVRETCIAGAKTIPAYLALLGVWRPAASITGSPLAPGSPPGWLSRWPSSWRRSSLNDDLKSLAALRKFAVARARATR
jgi:hypothetical protein